MTVYFAAMDEPLESDNWQTLEAISADGMQLEQAPVAHYTVDIDGRTHQNTQMRHTVEFKVLSGNVELLNLFYGFNYIELVRTVSGWRLREHSANTVIPPIKAAVVVSHSGRQPTEEELLELTAKFAAAAQISLEESKDVIRQLGRIPTTHRRPLRAYK